LDWTVRRFAGCIGSEEARAEVLKDVQESRRAGFAGTPTFVINGRPLRGAVGLQDFQRAIDAELQKRKEEQKK
jgi:protein-disulfide isomerase